MDQVLAVLKRCELFRGMTEDNLGRSILPHGQLREIAQGQYLIAPQQKVDQLGILLSGKIHILHLFSDGNYSLMNVLTVSDAVGADLVCTGSRIAPYHALAAAPGKILLFPAEVFLRPGRLEESLRLEVLGRLLRLISNDNMKKEYRLAILSQKGLRERVMTYLTMQANKRRTNTFSIPFSREELASYLCVNRSALSHELSLMQQEGLISFQKNSFTLLLWEPLG